MKFRIKVKGECIIVADTEEEAIEKALIYFSEDIQGNLDVEEITNEEFKEKCCKCGKEIEDNEEYAYDDETGNFCCERCMK